METLAVVIQAPERLAVRRLGLTPPKPGDVTVEIDWSGVSTGTERLLYTGRMPAFPGMGYPLVPGYESVGRVVEGPRERLGERVFVGGANCFEGARGLFGGAARHLVVAGDRALQVGVAGPEGALLALAATAHHAIAGGAALPDLIVGHGVVGRLLARLTVAAGGSPTVWETNASRVGEADYAVLHPDEDTRRDYRVIVDASGDATLLDTLIGRLGKGGEIVLAGFYVERLGFDFAPAFMREARLRVAAEWSPGDLIAVRALLDAGALSLDGLVTHRAAAADAPDAYRTAFGDAACLKMVLDWSGTA